jgi:SulP family sulfate permease
LIATALRESISHGITRASLRADLLAGATVALVALPLGMALAIAAGAPPQHGLFTCILAGGLTALLGGSRLNVTGPTAAFAAILFPITLQHGLGGLTLATMLAGLMLLVMGLARLGRLIEFIPYPVTAGFTAGIAVVIAVLQLQDFLGLREVAAASHPPAKLAAMVGALPSWRWQEAAVGCATLGGLLAWTRFTRRVPAPLAVLALVTAGCAALHAAWPGFEVETIASRFGGIPRSLPALTPPWTLPGADGAPLDLDWGLVRELLGPAFAIALLAAIESLLCAVVADGMAGTRHDPNGELVGLGVGNIVAPFFGGIAATGAVARTATNVRSGARSPVAAVAHAVFVLLAMLALAPWLGRLPLAALAGLLLLVAWNMSDARHVARVLREAGRGDSAVLLVCMGLTIALDMTVAVVVGVLLAFLLFVRRMVDLTGVQMIEPPPADDGGPLPEGVVVYRVAGPLFFGAAEKAMSTLRRLPRGARALVLDLDAVPTMDYTGFVALDSAVTHLEKLGVRVTLAGVHMRILPLLDRMRWSEKHPQAPISVDGGLAVARRGAATAG